MIIKRLIKTIILLLWIISSANAQEVNYLRFTALEDNIQIGLTKNKINPNIMYSINNGDWTLWENDEIIQLTNENDFVLLKGNNTTISESTKNYATFTFSGKVKGSGNLMTLLDETGKAITISTKHCFYKLFADCKTLISAPDLTATILAEGCYNSMFLNCEALESINVSFNSWKTTDDKTFTSYWIKGVAEIGKFFCPSNLEEKNGQHYKPTKWKTNPYNIIINDNSIDDISITNSSIGYEYDETIKLEIKTKVGYTYEVTATGLSSHNNIEINKNSFKMPKEDVELSVTYTLIEYSISKPKYIKCDFEKAYIYNTEIPFSVRDSTAKGYRLSEVTINNTPINLNGYNYVFSMVDYAANITLRAKYELIEYLIHTDENCYIETDKATVKDKLTIKITDKSNIGYAVDKVYINEKSVKVNNLEATLDMSKYISDVYVTVEYKPISYNINKGENITCSRKTATVEDVIPFSIKNLKSQGLQISKVLVNNKEIEFEDYKASLIMADFISDVTITAEYELITFNINTGEYVTCNTKTATVESDAITFTVTDLTSEGYEISNVKIGTKSIPIENYAGSFLMSDFAKDVTITATYSAIKYQITKDENISCRKTTATVNDSVYFTIKDYSNSGLAVENVLINSKPISYKKEKPGIDMADFKCDVYISVEYKQLDYKITTDQNITSDHQFASINDLIKVNAKDLTSDGYELEKILVNGKSLTFYKNFCNFLMSEYKSDVEITTQYKPISYKVKAGRYVFTDKNAATVNDTVFFSVDDLSEDGRIFEYILVNGKQVDIKTFNDTIFMSDYISDISIEAVYSKYHSIKTDNNITEISHTTAQKDEQIQFKINPANDGYEPFVYVNSRRIFSPDRINYIFAMFDNDVDIYVDYQEIIVEEPETQEDSQDESEPDIIKKNSPKAINKIKVYPSVAKEGEIITISLENVDTEYFANSKIIIFDILGKSIKTFDKPQEISKIIMPKGIYKGVFISGNKKIRFDFAILK